MVARLCFIYTFISWVAVSSYSRRDNTSPISNSFMTRFLVLFLAALVLGSCSFLNRGPQSSRSDADPGASSPVPMFTDARQALDEGNRLLDINETEKAIEAFDQAVALDPDLAEAYFQLGIAHSLIENERKASAAPSENAESEEGKRGKPESVRAFEK